MGMATAKERINISVSTHTRKALRELAKRDQVPEATKAADLIELALDIEEDRVLEAIAHARDSKRTRWVSHAALWSPRKNIR